MEQLIVWYAYVITDVLEETSSSGTFFNPAAKDSRFLLNICIYVSQHIASYLKKL
jgi:hypothetical protein